MQTTAKNINTTQEGEKYNHYSSRNMSIGQGRFIVNYKAAQNKNCLCVIRGCSENT